MANQINTNHASVLLNNASRPAGKTAVQSEASQQSSAKGVESHQQDRVSMTPEAARLQKIEEQLSSVPSVDSAKVAAIKAAIADGSFTIDPQAIASKLIAYESV